MKKMMLLCAAFTTFNATAQIATPSGAALPPPLGRVVNDGKVFEVTSVENLPMKPPEGEIEKMRDSFKAKAADGISHLEKSPAKVKEFFEHHKAAVGYLVANEARKAQPNVAKASAPVPEVHKDLTPLNLSFKPVHFPRAKLLSAAPAGTIVNGKWTGVERFFSIPGVGIASLTEIDLAATKGKYSMLKEAVNGAVNGAPAISKVFMNELGDSVEEVIWMNANVYSRLTFGPDVVSNASGAKTKATRGLSGLSLAQEMQ